MADLRSQAMAVYDAFIKSPMALNHIQDDRNAIAAALRAAASKCAGLPDGRDCTELLLNIATELENHQ